MHSERESLSYKVARMSAQASVCVVQKLAAAFVHCAHLVLAVKGERETGGRHLHERHAVCFQRRQLALERTAALAPAVTCCASSSEPSPRLRTRDGISSRNSGVGVPRGSMAKTAHALQDLRATIA